MGKTESMTFEIEKNHGLYDKADNMYSLRVHIQNYVSNYICTMLPNDQI